MGLYVLDFSLNRGWMFGFSESAYKKIDLEGFL